MLTLLKPFRSLRYPPYVYVCVGRGKKKLRCIANTEKGLTLVSGKGKVLKGIPYLSLYFPCFFPMAGVEET